MDKGFSSTLVLVSLAISTFALGITEFISVGILPLISADLNVSIPLAGLTVSVYALGVTFGGPIITGLFSHFPKKMLVLSILAILIVGNIISSSSSSFEILLLSRVISSLSHGIFMSIGTIIATEVVPANKRASSIAIMFSGLTVSTIIGVPLGTFIGNNMGWRYAFMFIVGLSSLAFLLNLLFFPSNLKQSKKIALSSIFQILFNKRMILIFLMTGVGYGGTFVPFTYLTPILEQYGHFSANTVASILVIYGITIAIGNLIGGKFSNTNPLLALFWMFIINAVILIVFSLIIPLENSILLLISVTLMGLFAFMNVPALQITTIEQSKEYISEDKQLMASALNISSFNVGIALGSYLGQLTVSHISLGFTGYVGGGMLFIGAFLSYILYKTSNGDKSN